MSETKRKTTSVSLTISSPVHEGSDGYMARPSFSTLVQPLSMDLQRMPSPCSSLSGSTCGAPPIFTKLLQDITATKGQFVVFECRVQNTGAVQVHWYKGEEQIVDSDDFRILRKKACLSAVPEEVCTLVMTEVFPEDSGEFKCIAENEAGTTSSSAWLSVSPGEEMEKIEDSLQTPKRQAFLKPSSYPWTRESPAKERDTDTETPADQECSIPMEDIHFLNDSSSELSSHW
ncbi:palladin-like [Monodelphis domestica]|uniref:palladin-like n=1 Tax=Monodelphis domestica TaxID=13616 RepID=UPI0024E21F98|nr:palladin-like [Monodelphis domestica]